MSKLNKKQKLWLGLGIPLGTVITTGIVVSLVFMSIKNVFNNSCKYLGQAKDASYIDYNFRSDEKFQNYVDEVNLFSAKFTADYLNLFDDQKKNIAISPISLYSALSMAAESSKGNTQSEILTALGSSLENIEKYADSLYSLMNEEFTNGGLLKDHKVGECDLSNSIWIQNNIDVNQSTLNVLTDNFHADVFKANFAKRPKRVGEFVSHYVKDKTHNLIDKKYDFDSSTLLVLLNTLYLKDTWNVYGTNLNKSDLVSSFINRNGNVVDKDFYVTKYFSGKTSEEESFKYFDADTDHGVCLTFIVPNDGVDIGSLMNKENVDKVLSLRGEYLIRDDIKREEYHTRVHFPEFHASSSSELSNFLKSSFGISSMFSEEADFSKLIPNGAVYVSSVDHTVELSVDKKGIEGAAATAIIGVGAAGPGEYEQVYEDFIVNKSFGFVVSLNYSIPLFSGIVNYI